MAVKKGGLGPKGRGLGALLESTSKEVSEHTDGSVVLLDINKIEPNREQPRKHFQEDALEELSESIKNYGVFHSRAWSVASAPGLPTILMYQ